MVIIGVPAGIAIGIALYYLLMPAWILILRYDYDETLLPQVENRVEFQPNDLRDLPTLREAILQADRDYPFGHTQAIGAPFLEGKRMVERFQMSQSFPPEYRAILINRDIDSTGTDEIRAYFVQVVFDYNRPQIQ